MKITHHHFKDVRGVNHSYVRIVRVIGSVIISETISLVRYLAGKATIDPRA